MPTAYLHGNHDDCEACALRREAEDTAPVLRDPVPCNFCGGWGFLARSEEEIVRLTLAEAREAANRITGARS